MPKKRELVNDVDIGAVLECEIKWPKKTKKVLFWWEKRHILKVQIITDERNLKILNIIFSSGKTHDFKLFKDSKVYFLENVLIIADRGYLGINKIHKNSLIPKKASKKHKLTKEDKEYNLSISKCRIL